MSLSSKMSYLSDSVASAHPLYLPDILTAQQWSWRYQAKPLSPEAALCAALIENADHDLRSMLPALVMRAWRWVSGHGAAISFRHCCLMLKLDEEWLRSQFAAKYAERIRAAERNRYETRRAEQRATDSVRQVIARLGRRPFTAAGIAQEIGQPNRHVVTGMLHRFFTRGEVERLGCGWYRAADKLREPRGAA